MDYSSAATFELSAASAWAGIVSPRSSNSFSAHVLSPHPCHDICWSALFPEFRCHELHAGIDVRKEQFVAGAEVIQTLFPVRRWNKSVFWALAIADKAHLAFMAAPGQLIQLVLPKTDLLRRMHH